MQFITLPEYIYFVVLSVRTAKFHHRRLKYQYWAKVLAQLDLVADMECVRRIETLVPACLSQDGDWTDFFIVSKTIAWGLSIGLTFILC